MEEWHYGILTWERGDGDFGSGHGKSWRLTDRAPTLAAIVEDCKQKICLYE